MRKHPLEIDPLLWVVIALAPQHDDPDTPAEIAHHIFWIAPLLLVVAPEGFRDPMN
ncbi:MAG: hypothetical protein ACRDJ9_30080 [Dehalococcoidia bacterium]